MAFKMKGSPFQRNFGIGSPLKKEEKAYGGTKTWSEGEDAAGRHNQNLNDLVRERNKHDKNTNPYNIAQNKINQFLGSSVRHAVESDETTNVRTNTTDKSDKVVVKNTETGDKDKIKTKYYDDDKEQIKKEKIVTKDGDGTEKTVVKYDKEGNLIPTRVVPAFKAVPKREADGTVIPNETNVEMTYKAFEDGLTQIEETPDDPGLLGSAKEFLRDPTNIDLLAQKYRPGTAENRRLTSLLRDNDVTTVSDINRLSNANQVRIASFIISSIPEKDRGNMVDNIFKAINLLRTGDPKRTGADEARDERTARKSLRAENLQEREFNFKVQNKELESLNETKEIKTKK